MINKVIIMRKNGIELIKGMFNGPAKMIQQEAPVIEEIKPKKKAKRKRKAVKDD